MATANPGFYGTETETFYLAPSGRAWLVGSEDELPNVREVESIPSEATSLDGIVTPEEAIEWCGQIEVESGESLLESA